ncbi:MAG: ribosome recycling factor [Clostridia bacterium]|nr:ribosome recycling factor [Clostridia bacterium]
MKNNYPEFDAKMQKCIEALAHELSTIRAGRASAAILDKVMVDYYGSATPIAQVAAISVPEPRSLTVTPWDPQVLKAAEKAILQSDVGITPVNDGKCLRLTFPPLTEERRKELAKNVKKFGEEAKVAIRNIRRDALDKFKAQKKKAEITEDDLKIAEKDITELVDKKIKEVEKVVEAKEKEILEV